MEQEKKYKWLKYLAGTALLILSMFILAVTSYHLARKKAPRESSNGAYHSSQTSLPNESSVPFNLPTSVQTVVPEQPEPEKPENRYLVLAEETAVNLYILTENGEQVYAGELPISLSALMPNDRTVLEEGIVLASDEELAYLLEDYSS